MFPFYSIHLWWASTITLQYDSWLPDNLAFKIGLLVFLYILELALCSMGRGLTVGKAVEGKKNILVVCYVMQGIWHRGLTAQCCLLNFPIEMSVKLSFLLRLRLWDAFEQILRGSFWDFKHFVQYGFSWLSLVVNDSVFHKCKGHSVWVDITM